MLLLFSACRIAYASAQIIANFISLYHNFNLAKVAETAQTKFLIKISKNSSLIYISIYLLSFGIRKTVETSSFQRFCTSANLSLKSHKRLADFSRAIFWLVGRILISLFRQSTVPIFQAGLFSLLYIPLKQRNR